MNFYQSLRGLGLVRVQRPDGTYWWVGRAKAEELERTGQVVLAPLADAELKARDK